MLGIKLQEAIEEQRKWLVAIEDLLNGESA